MSNPRHQISLAPGAVLRAMLIVSVLLVLFHLLGLFFKYSLGHDYVFGFVPMFDLNSERNAPTLFSSLLLVSCGALCIFAGRIAPRWRFQWWFMGLVFVMLGIDETFGLHEPLFFVLRGNRSESTAALADSLGGLRWPNLLPWLALIGVGLLIWYWSLIRHVGRRVLMMALCSAVVYLFGVAIIDNILVVEAEHNYSLVFIQTLSVLEEICEFVGASLFIYAMLLYFANKHDINIRITQQA